MNHLAIIETILRDRHNFFAEIRDEVNFLASYGLVMGASHSVLQSITAFFKLPVLFLLTLAICTPSLHFFNILFGSKQTILQSVTLILTAIATTAVLLFSLSPITLFFLTTSSEYQFYKLLNVTCFALAGSMGVVFLRQGMQIVTEDSNEGIKTRRLVFLFWSFLYGFVGSQMAWTLSPFIGAPDKPFILFRNPGGNFYLDILDSISQLLGG